jgi:hypothetical protein
MEHGVQDIDEREGHRADGAGGGDPGGIDSAMTPRSTSGLVLSQLHRTTQVSSLYTVPRLHSPQISMMRATSPE